MRLASFILLLPLAACNISDGDSGPGIAASGSGNTRAYAADGFTGVTLAGPDDVDVRVGSGFTVRAEGDPNTLDKLRLEVRNGALRIGRRNSHGWEWNSKGGAKVYVTLPRLTDAVLAGSGNFAVDRVDGSGFDAKIAGSGDLTIGALAVTDAEFSIAGAGTLTAKTGTADKLAMSIAGSGDIDAKGVTAGAADVKIAGAGSVNAQVDGPASVKILGSGDVDLGPKARCDVKKMGSGSVRCAN